MNAKLAKRLRKMALTIANQAKQHTGNDIPFVDYKENQANRKKYPTQARDDKGILMTNDDGTPVITWVEYTVGTLTLSETSVRGIYQKLKRDYNRDNSMNTRLPA